MAKKTLWRDEEINEYQKKYDNFNHTKEWKKLPTLEKSWKKITRNIQKIKWEISRFPHRIPIRKWANWQNTLTRGNNRTGQLEIEVEGNEVL